MAMLSAQAFAVFLVERAAKGDGYIMCAIGQNPKKLSEWYFSGQYSGDALRQANKWRETCERVWDCQGLADGYCTDNLGYTINVRARNNYATWCDPKGSGAIPAAYRLPGAAVFVHDAGAGYITHVGFLVAPVDAGNPGGDWWVVEARGVMYGVVRRKLSAGRWNRWGLMTKYFDYEGGGQVAAYELGQRVLCEGCVGDDVKSLQGTLIDLGYSCGKWGADGEFGAATKAAVVEFQAAAGLVVTGEYGQDDHNTLMRLVEDADEFVDARANPYAEPVHDVRKGYEGDNVRWVQVQLLFWDATCLPGWGIDGDFGAETAAAVRAYQRARGLGVDGIVGKATRAALKLESM